MSLKVWDPVSRENCGEKLYDKWKSTVADQRTELVETPLALRRRLQKDKDLQQLTNELLHRREVALVKKERDFCDQVVELNRCSVEEIKLLTSWLLEFLHDIRTNVDNSCLHSDVVGRWKTDWFTTIEDWKSDVDVVLDRLKSNISQCLRSSQRILIDTRKYTSTQTDEFGDNQVNKLNDAIMKNLLMYKDTERRLKLYFDVLLQNWISRRFYQEALEMEEWNEYNWEEAGEICGEEPLTLKNLIESAEQLLASVEANKSVFWPICSLKVYFFHLGWCQNSAIVHANEAIEQFKIHLQSAELGGEGRPVPISGIEDQWMKLGLSLKHHIEELTNYLKNTSSAWNQFMRRLLCAENMTHISLSQFKRRRIANIARSEQDLNILMDHLRECGSAAQLVVTLKHIFSDLTHVETRYVACRDGEDDLLKQLVKAFFAAFDVYDLQISHFNETPPESEGDCLAINLDDWTDYWDDSEYMEAKCSVFAVQTWLAGLKETMKLLVGELPKFLRTFLQHLIFNYKGETELWLMLQLEKLTKRKRRIQQNVFDVRFAELKEHELVLHNLTEAIDKQSNLAQKNVEEVKKQLRDLDDKLFKQLGESNDKGLIDTAEKKLMNLKDKRTLAEHEHTREQVIKKTKSDMERLFKWFNITCLNYVTSLRLFHEGGNYSSYEVSVALKKVDKIIKGLAPRRKQVLKKVDHSLGKLKHEFEKKLAKLPKHRPTNEELSGAAERECNSQLELLFNRLKEKLIRETSKAKTTIDTLQRNISTAELANNFEKWRETISLVQEPFSYFSIPANISTLEISSILNQAELLKLSPRSEEGDDQNDKTIKRQSVNHKKKTVKKSQVAAKQSQMSMPSGEDNYLSTVKKLLSETTKKIGTVLVEAFKKYHLSPKESEHLQLEAMSVLMHYNLQCESAWAFLFREYLHNVHSVYAGALCFVDTATTRFAYDFVNEAMLLKVDHSKELTLLNESGSKESIDNRLKPWHGYPLNKPLLQELIRLVVTRCKGQLTSRKVVNELYKDELKALVSRNKETAIQLLEEVKLLYFDLFVDNTMSNLLDAAFAFIDNKGFGRTDIEPQYIRRAVENYCSTSGTKKHSDKLSPSEPKKYDFIHFPSLTEFRFWCFPQYMNELVEMLKYFRGKLRAVSDPTQELMAVGAEGEELLLIAEDWRYEELELCQLWREFTDQIRTNTQAFESSAVQNLTRAKRDFDRLSTDLTRWKDEWISNIREVNRLYLINPILDPPPKRLSSNPAAALQPKTQRESSSISSKSKVKRSSSRRSSAKGPPAKGAKRRKSKK